MTKHELLALAAAGHANIKVAYTITRYYVSPKCLGAADSRSEAAIFFSISNEDGSVYDDDAYFIDNADDEVPLTREEANALAEIVTASKAPL
jgi:hypothetical protein